MAQSNSVFISYRRSASAFVARAVFEHLNANGIDAFLDIDYINVGQFDTIILNQIAARPYFLLILTPGTLERCVEPGDWMLREITRAATTGRAIIPLFTPEFKMSDVGRYLPEPYATDLPRWNGVKISYEFFEEGMDRLRNRFLKPSDIPITPPPDAEAVAVQDKIAQVSAQESVTASQLSAQEFYERSFTYPDSDVAAKIADLTEALKLNPDFAEALSVRAGFRNMQGDYAGTIEDATAAIRLAPQFADAYYNRALGYHNLGDWSKAIADYNEAARLNPTDVSTYVNRGVVRDLSGDHDGAIKDYNAALHLNPRHTGAYNNRGAARFDKGDLDGALADYSAAMQLTPEDPDLYENHAEASDARGDRHIAAVDYRRLLELRPDHPKADIFRKYIEGNS